MTEALWLRVMLPGLFLTASGMLLFALLLALAGHARQMEPRAEDDILAAAIRRGR